ncbi:uncharacterized protein LOC126747227 [Anthonomus grandis grandis]|uniref:uncharacterized protein LOC126747227 n=1 Tax=Anthonomus grandis grandis TaxID=2921223 RepID=UPI002165A164|nr:uncharacterized protein LOC126747227 [Anthonomus grandis grandis]
MYIKKTISLTPISKMLHKALIFLAAVSAIAAEGNLTKQVYQKINEYKNLYSLLSENSYKIAEEAFSQTNHIIANLTGGLQETFSYNNASKKISDLEAQAKNLGMDISNCLLLNQLDFDQAKAIINTTETLGHTYTEYSTVILMYLELSLDRLHNDQTNNLSKYETTMDYCLLRENQPAQNTCLWELLTEVHLGITLFHSEGVLLEKTVGAVAVQLEEKMPEVVLECETSWRIYVDYVVGEITNCAQNVFNNDTRE